MGCQGSKGVATAEPPSRTLLVPGESPKTPAGDAQVPVPANATEESHTTGMAEGATPSSKGNAPGMNGQMHSMMMRRQRTLCSERYELDVMVSQFTSHDSTVGNAVGRNCKDMEWKVMFDPDAAPVDIKLHVQEHKLHSNEVSIESNGQAIFHGAGSYAKAKMTEDFCYQWPFRGTIRGINEINYYEVCPSHLNSQSWFPATITSQRKDGFFEVTAQQPDARGFIVNVKYPAVHKADLREASSQRPLCVPESCLMLHVPKQDPLRAVLSVEGELVTHHFGRPSPAPTKDNEKRKVALHVSQDRSVVTADVGHGVLSHFVSGQPRSVTCDVERLMHSWTFQLGPFAQHSVKILKNYTLGKIITLMVDGEVFVESSAADIGCQGNGWQCHFSFVGERVLDFEVFKTNMDGAALDETAHVEERRKYMHECSVVIPNERDLSTAQFLIDGVDFRDLPVQPQSFHKEAPLSMEPRVMLQSYGIAVPYKVDHAAPCGILRLTKQIPEQIESTKKVASDFFVWCCAVDSSVSEIVDTVHVDENPTAEFKRV